MPVVSPKAGFPSAQRFRISDAVRPKIGLFGRLWVDPGVRQDGLRCAWAQAMLLTSLVLAAQVGASDVVDLLDAEDPWIRAWAERRVERPLDDDAVEPILERGARSASFESRRDAVAVELRGSAGWRERGPAARFTHAFTLNVSVAWDALLLGPPSEILDLPGEERARRRRCAALVEPPVGGVAGLAYAARRSALGCEEGPW